MNNSPLNPLRAGLLIMVLILVGGVLFFKYLPSLYDRSASESAFMAGNPELLSAKQFDSIIAHPPKNWLLVNMSQSLKSLPPESMIYVLPADLTNKKLVRKMRRSSKVVILADNATIAHQTAMILEMMGVRALVVDAPASLFSEDYVKAAKDSMLFDPSEKSHYRYQQVLKALEMEDKPPVIEVKVPVPSAGGC